MDSNVGILLNARLPIITLTSTVNQSRELEFRLKHMKSERL